MAKKLFKLAMTATTTTQAKPTTTNAFSNVATGLATAASYTFLANTFFNDNGIALTGFVTVASNNGFQQFFINGQMQQEGTVAVSASKVVVTYATATPLTAHAPITLAVTNFAPASSTTVQG